MAIVSSLGASLYYLLRDQGQTKRMVGALSVRILLSLLLFIGLWVACSMGWVAPHGILTRMVE